MRAVHAYLASQQPAPEISVEFDRNTPDDVHAADIGRCRDHGCGLAGRCDRVGTRDYPCPLGPLAPVVNVETVTPQRNPWAFAAPRTCRTCDAAWTIQDTEDWSVYACPNGHGPRCSIPLRDLVEPEVAELRAEVARLTSERDRAREERDRP